MGFHKRFVSADNLLKVVQYSGIEGLDSYFGADALIFSDDASHQVFENYKQLTVQQIEDILTKN